jgi:hypothetical protein
MAHFLRVFDIVAADAVDAVHRETAATFHGNGDERRRGKNKAHDRAFEVGSAQRATVP